MKHPLRTTKRIEQILAYIEHRLDQPLSVAQLCAHCGWSRWQLQRVFQHATGLSIGQYLRQRRLSRAAEYLLNTPKRHIDIALQCGFSSEISFNRAFRQYFNCTPGEYRRARQSTGLTLPIKLAEPSSLSQVAQQFLPIRIETRPAFSVAGVHSTIHGLLSSNPDFSATVPATWQQLIQHLEPAVLACRSAIGIIDTQRVTDHQHDLSYWAALELGNDLTNTALTHWQVPEQTYAVIPHHGPVSQLQHTLSWVFFHWLPTSGKQGCFGFELERYGANYQPTCPHAYMEYWLPITP